MKRKSTLIFTLLFFCLMMTSSVVATQDMAVNLVPQAYFPIIPKHDLERDALMALYHSTDGPNWYRNDGWGSEEPYCDWYGVICYQGEVLYLWLSANRLHGSIPSKLGSLSNLNDLDLSDNQLSGSIPAELGNLGNLGSLWLSHNQLTGPIPAELGNLSHLGALNLSGNQLIGPIPAELGNLSGLRELYLDLNQLTGPIPAELGNLGNLSDLYLEDNQLTGPIPAELGNLSYVKSFSLENNQLSGPIPPELVNLGSERPCLSHVGVSKDNRVPPTPWPPRVYINLSNNHLIGPIPPELGYHSCLGGLKLNNNDLSGPIPAALANLSILINLHLENNPGLVCWETVAARDWAVSLSHYEGPTAVCSSANCTQTLEVFNRSQGR